MNGFALRVSARACRLLALLLLCALCRPLGALAAQQQDLSLRTVGSAHVRDGSELLYREYHYCDRSGENREPSEGSASGDSDGVSYCRVEYRDSEGELIALKTVDYRGAPVAPVVLMRDFRRDLELSGPESDGAEKVVDAGFDNFVRSRWQALRAGERVGFEFFALGMGGALDMVAARDDAADCGPAQLCLSVAPRAWWLNWLAQPIELVYSLDRRRLQVFSGISNLRGREGERLYVDIVYRYTDEGAGESG